MMAGWVTGDGAFLGQTDMTVAEYQAEAEALYGEQASEFMAIFPASTDEEVKQMKNKLTLINFAGFPNFYTLVFALH